MVSENRIKELKEDVSLQSFCLQSFDATDAACRTGCVLYHLLMGVRGDGAPVGWFERRLRAVRDWVLLVGADCIPQARIVRVRFAVPREERQEYLQRLRTLAEGLPIAAQFEGDLLDTDDEDPPSPGGVEATVPTVWRAAEAHGASP